MKLLTYFQTLEILEMFKTLDIRSKFLEIYGRLLLALLQYTASKVGIAL